MEVVGGGPAQTERGRSARSFTARARRPAQSVLEAGSLNADNAPRALESRLENTSRGVAPRNLR